MHLTKPLMIVSLVCITSFFGCAALSGDLENRINGLENRSIFLEQKLSESEAQLAVQGGETKEKLLDSTAHLNADIDGILENVKGLAGRIEVVEHQMEIEAQARSADAREQTARFAVIEEALQDTERRISRIEASLNSGASAGVENAPISPPLASSQAPSSAMEGEASTDIDLYKSAKTDFDNGEYDVAKQKFLELIQNFPKSENADNAHFWIGEMYFNQELYEKAILEYEKVIKNYPDGNKVPAAYLKQGIAFYTINNKNTAKILLEEVISKYPDSDEAELAREKLKTFD